MKKVLIGLAVLIVIVAIGATVFVGKMDELIADAIQTEGTAALGTTVSVTKVETDLKAGSAVINGLSIANPPGYQATNALTVGSFTADVDYETQVVEKIVISSPVINAEVKDSTNNFETLLANMPEDVEEEVVEGEEEMELTIKTLQMRNAKINLIADKLGSHSFAMDDFVINDLSGSAEQISERLTRALTDHVSKQVKDYAAQEIAKMVEAEVKEKVEEVVNEKLNEKLKGKFGDKLKSLKLGIK